MPPVPTTVEAVHRHRGVEDPCPPCQGYGTRWYPNTATWRGGMGGCTVTSDVCDACWGSGDAHRPWLNLATRDAELDRCVAERVADHVQRRLGLRFETGRAAWDALLVELGKLGAFRSRKPRPPQFREACTRLATLLGELRAHAAVAALRDTRQAPAYEVIPIGAHGAHVRCDICWAVQSGTPVEFQERPPTVVLSEFYQDPGSMVIYCPSCRVARDKEV